MCLSLACNLAACSSITLFFDACFLGRVVFVACENLMVQHCFFDACFLGRGVFVACENLMVQRCFF